MKLDWCTAHVMRSQLTALASVNVGKVGGVELTLADMWRAGSGNFLNDNCK